MMTLPIIPTWKIIYPSMDPNINNKSQDFELISNHSIENIIDKVNTNDQTENTFNEFREDINEYYYSTPNIEAINDNNTERSSCDFNLNTDVKYDNTSENTISNLALNYEAITVFTDNELISPHNDKITNELPIQLNFPSTSNNHINKRKIQSSDLIIKKPKIQYNGISSPLKRSESPLLKEDHK